MTAEPASAWHIRLKCPSAERMSGMLPSPMRTRSRTDLRNILEDEISGLSEEVRHRMLTILDENVEAARNIRNNVASELR